MYTYTVVVMEKFLFIYYSIFVPFLLNGTEANGNYSMIATVCEYDKCSTVYYYTCICWMFGRQHACIRVYTCYITKLINMEICVYMYIQYVHTFNKIVKAAVTTIHMYIYTLFKHTCTCRA